MDIETLTNHISNLGKTYFDKACQLVLSEVFNLNAINIDGAYDGGTDILNIVDGSRENAAYQITTQKTDIKNKAYKDAKKAIKKFQIPVFASVLNTKKIQTPIVKLEFGLFKVRI